MLWIGKDYLLDISNLASTIDVSELEAIVDTASTLRQKTQRNVALYDMGTKICRLRKAVKQG